MARTPNVRIVEWGTPPEAEPTGWEAVAIELDRKPGKWASLGEFSNATARKIMSERLPAENGFETRTVPSKSADNRVVVWARKSVPDDAPDVVKGSK